ncbi:MAG: hypothetical protein IKK74_09465 [Clostridia bacterium]|nr:hypothetical protein [Clostridia bacterium]MBR6579156.1 hypothetical protein [Clostridia bacterium]
MSNSWNEFCDGAGRFFDKLSSEAVRLTDAAGMQIKLENVKNRLEKEYATLGKLTYAKLNGGSDNAEKIEASLSRIAELRKTEKEIERDIKEAKAEKDAQKEADKAAKDAK